MKKNIKVKVEQHERKRFVKSLNSQRIALYPSVEDSSEDGVNYFLIEGNKAVQVGELLFALSSYSMADSRLAELDKGEG